MKRSTPLLTLLLFSALLLALLPTSTAKVITVGPPDSGADYSSIQEAVKNADPGDTILVYPGNYTEDVRVGVDSLCINASVTSEGVVWLVGCFQVGAYNVTIANFHVDATLKDYSVRFNSTARDCKLLNSLLLPMGVQVDSGAEGISIEDCIVAVMLNEGIKISGDNCRVERTLVFVQPIPLPLPPYVTLTIKGISLNGANNATIDTCGVIVLYLHPPSYKVSFSGVSIKDSHNCLLKLCCIAINHSDTKTRSIVFQSSSDIAFKGVLLVTYNLSLGSLPNITTPSQEFNLSWLDMLTDFIVTASNVSFIPGGDFEMRSSLERIAPPEDYTSTLSYLDISGSLWLYINFTYLPDPEINESTYAVWMYSGGWSESGWYISKTLDTSKNIVGVNITSLSEDFKTFAVLAKKNVENITLELHPGWNLISIPIDEELTPEQLLEGCEASYVIYAWNPEDKAYYTPEVLQPGQGYWVYVSSDVSITIKGGALYHYSIPLSKGWNLIGSASHPAAVVATTAEYYPILWTWMPEEYRYRQALFVEPALGYWVYAMVPGSVEIVSS